MDNSSGNLNESELLLVANILDYQRTLFQRGRSNLDPLRNIDEECHYPDVNGLRPNDYRDLYDKFGVAQRVVNLLPDETWGINPEIYESEKESEETEFEQAWKRINQQLEEESLFVDEESSPIWECLKRADQLSGIGRFGAILLGVGIPDDDDLALPLPGFEDDKTSTFRGTYNAAKPIDLLYLRAFDESLVDVAVYEDNRKRRRYGQPKEYNITLSDPMISHEGIGHDSGREARVHWSRVIHIADNLSSSEIYGTPRQQAVFHHLLDLRKLYGGSAEMYWQGAFPGLSFETHPQLGNTIKMDADAMRTQVQQYFNGLQRYLAMTGASAKTLSPQVVDPTNQIERSLDAICIKIGCPKRIFIGSERGELASSQDSDTWAQRLQNRRLTYVNPRIIKRFIDRLIRIGVLPKPKEYHIKWGAKKEPTAVEQASLAAQRMQAVSAYIQSGADVLIPPVTFLVKELGYDREEAEATLEEASQIEEEKAQEEAEQQAEFQKNQPQPSPQGNVPPKASGQMPPGVPQTPPGSPPKQQTANHATQQYEGQWEGSDEYGSWRIVANAESQGSAVPDKLGGRKLNRPFRTPKGPKKFAVYVKNDKGDVVIVRFGDPNMKIKRDNPERRANFRARHQCDDNPGPKWKPRYWACKTWTKTPVSQIVNVESEGIWRTTDDGSKIFIKDGEVRAGGPKGKVLKGKEETQTEKPKEETKLEENPKEEIQQKKEDQTKESEIVRDAQKSLKELGYNVADLSEVPQELQADLLSSLENLKKDFPGIENHLGIIRTASLPDGVPFTYRVEGGSKSLRIDPEQITAASLKEVEKAQGSGWLASKDGWKGILAHELAHAIDKAPFSSTFKWGLQNAKTYLKNNPPTAKDLSKYGTQAGPHQKEEMFAEAFAAAYTQENPNKWQQGFNASLKRGLTNNQSSLSVNTIKKIGPSRWRVLSSEGRNLGTFGSEEAAKKRLQQVEYFKHVNNFDPSQPRDEDGRWTDSGSKGLDHLGKNLVEHPKSKYTPGMYSSPQGATLTRFSGTSEIESLSATVYRVGDISDKPRKGGSFFAGDPESIKPYMSLHEGQEIKEYDVSLEKVFIAGHQNDLTKAWFGKTYGEMMDSFQRRLGSKGADVATAAFDKKIANEAKKRGYSGIVYMSPAPPAKTELMIIGDANKKIKDSRSLSVNSKGIWTTQTVNFDPNQPRDEDGKWSSGFHGTNSLEAIKQTGLKKTAGSNGALLGEGVYIAKSKQTAQSYGKDVLEFALTELNIKEFKSETAYKKFLHKKGIEDFEPKTMTKFMQDLGYDGVSTGNVAVVFDPEKLTVNFDPDQLRDEDGKWTSGASSIKLPEYAIKQITQGDRINILDRSKRHTILKSLGAEQEAINELDKLFDYHRHGGSSQEYADQKIFEELNKSTPLGKAIRAQIQLEEYIHSELERTRDDWVNHHEAESKRQMKAAWEGKYPPMNDDAYENWTEQWETMEKYHFDEMRKPTTFYRKGGATKNVLATSTNPEGAQAHSVTGAYQPRFEPDHQWNAKELQSLGYRILGGYAYGFMGYSGESEVTWIKYEEPTTNKSRCWEGYEPVPGKEPYSEDSCRPIGSGKKKKKEDEVDTSETTNAFCPTGPGGGVDNSCSPKSSGKKVYYQKELEVADEVDLLTISKILAKEEKEGSISNSLKKLLKEEIENIQKKKIDPSAIKGYLEEKGLSDDLLYMIYPEEEGGSPNEVQSSFPKDLTGLIKVQNLGGSTGAILVKDPTTGSLYVQKKGNNEGHLRNEFAVEQLYKAMGVPVLDSNLYETSDGPVKLSKYLADASTLGSLGKAEYEKAVKELQKNFALDATLANWDVVGMNYDNVMVTPDGTVYRIDVAGSLDYRAQGAKKGSSWNNENTELDTMRTNPKNLAANKVFGTMTNDQIASSIENLIKNKSVLLNDAMSKLDGETFLTLKARVDKAASRLNEFKGDKKDPVMLDLKSLKTAIASNKGDLKLPKDLTDKIEFLNPNGVVGNQLFVPMITGPSGTWKVSNKDVVEHLKKTLSPGIELQGIAIKKLHTGEYQFYTKAEEKTYKNMMEALGKTPMLSSEPAPTNFFSGKGILFEGKLPSTSVNASYISMYDSEISTDHLKDVNLSWFEKEAINAWGNGAYKKIRTLYTNPDIYAAPVFVKMNDNFVKGLSKIPAYQGVVHRGLIPSDYTSQEIENIKKAGIGGTWTDPAPHSASRGMRGYPLNRVIQGGLLLTIKTKTGKPVHEFTGVPNEKEVIGLPGTQYKILGIHETPTVIDHVTSIKSSPDLHVELEEI
jgi:hypothetical protein